MGEDIISKKIRASINKELKEYIDEVLENGELDAYKKMSEEEIIIDFGLWIKERR